MFTEAKTFLGIDHCVVVRYYQNHCKITLYRKERQKRRSLDCRKTLG